jgi:serine/threonine protein kinase
MSNSIGANSIPEVKGGSDSTTTSTSASALRAPVLFRDGKVQRMKLLGRGANGSVYSCMLPDGSVIAMKEVLLPRSASTTEMSEIVDQVMREVEIVSSLEHPNVVRFYGSALEEEEGRLTIFMELIPSGSLASMVRSMTTPMSEDVARVFARQIVAAVAYIHRQGVVHRDIKCDNLLLTGDGQVKLTDFGASRSIGFGTIATRNAQTMIGTPFFMAPEVLTAGEDDGTPGYGRRADVWSMGITILEMMNCGTPPWPSFPSTGAAFMHIASPDALPIIPAGVSEEGRDFLGRCCMRDPRQRATCDELLEHPWLAPR